MISSKNQQESKELLAHGNTLEMIKIDLVERKTLVIADLHMFLIFIRETKQSKKDVIISCVQDSNDSQDSLPIKVRPSITQIL